MKRGFTFIMLLGLCLSAFSQSITSPFFEKVNYIGAFDGQNDWTAGWANFDPKNTVYPDPAVTKGNGDFTLAGGLKITSDETWSGVIKLDGWVYVQASATLTIQAGTVIRGTSKSALIIERGAKINAVGTAQSPIVFTSMNGVGLRGTSNWAGIIICGKAPKNFAGDGISEGGTGAVYGGDDPNDNSGTMKYVRIEFPGYEVATGKEINGLTLYSVGAATTIDYIQVSYSGDDAFEWFGGNVNAKHLIAYKTEDDDFDTDLGYRGMVQYAVALRDSAIVDTDAANCFESDNDESGSANTPYTRAIFSNVSGFGPAVAAGSPAVLKTNHAGGAAMRLRRNTRLQIHNSIFAGWGIGVRIEGTATKEGMMKKNSLDSDSLTIQNTVVAGIRTSDWCKTDAGVYNATEIKDWFLDFTRKNDTITSNSKLNVQNPFNYIAPNFLLKAGSGELFASRWYPVNPVAPNYPSIDNKFFDRVPFIGAFGNSDNWTSGWASFDPQNNTYSDASVTKGNGQFSYATGTQIISDETWSGTVKLDGWVYVRAPATLTILPGTVIRGTQKSTLVIERGGKIYAAGTAGNPIIFTSNNGVGLRGPSNWGGVVICGKAPMNQAGGTGVAEGGIGAPYGGDDPADSSGVFKYVRIEFPGYEVATGKEVNGLTLYSVGSKTLIDYVQVSYSGDDGFEWFGGNVNAKHLISYKTEDDDFDTDMGYRGMVQYAVALRDSSIVDTDAANCFESDNDEPGSSLTPLTRPIFSNVSGFGPAVTLTSPSSLKTNHAGGAALRLRRNTNIQIYNSLFAGWGIGLRLEGANTKTAAQNDSLTIQNTVIAGIRTADWFKTDAGGMTASEVKDWFNAASRGNDSVFSNSKIGVIDPFSYTNPNFLLKTGANEHNFSRWAIKNIDLTSQGGASAITTDGGSLQFFVDYSPKYLNSEFTWSIVPGTTQKATISQGGLLTASSTDGGNGNLYVKVTSLANGLADSMLITISNQSGADVLVTNINLSGAGGLSGITGSGTLTLIATILPEQASIKAVTWSVDKPEVATINAEGVLTAVSNGTVIVTATAQDGSGVKGTLSVSIIGVSIDDPTGNNILIYPNPVQDILNFRNSGGIVKVEIINVLGNVVRSIPVQFENELQIPVDELKKGVYFVRTTDVDNITNVRKILKK